MNDRRCPAEVTLATGERGQCHKPWGHELVALRSDRVRSRHVAVVDLEGRSHPVTWLVNREGVEVDVTVERPVAGSAPKRAETRRRSWLRGLGSGR